MNQRAETAQPRRSPDPRVNFPRSARMPLGRRGFRFRLRLRLKCTFGVGDGTTTVSSEQGCVAASLSERLFSPRRILSRRFRGEFVFAESRDSGVGTGLGKW